MSLLHIPCKSESKRCPGKNFAQVGPHSTLNHVVSMALASRKFDDVVVSTDGYQAMEILKPFPDVELSPQSPSTVIQTTHDLLLIGDYDQQITIILPTACLLTIGDIQGIIDYSEFTNDPVMAVTRFPYSINQILSVDQAGYADLHLSDSKPNKDLFIDAGAIYTFPPGQFRDVHDMYILKMRTYQIPRYRGVDVDEVEDLEMVRRLFNGSFNTPSDSGLSFSFTGMEGANPGEYSQGGEIS